MSSPETLKDRIIKIRIQDLETARFLWDYANDHNGNISGASQKIDSAVRSLENLGYKEAVPPTSR